MLVVHEPDAVLAGSTVEQVVVGTDPAQPISGGGGFGGGIPEGSEEPAVGRVFEGVPVAGERAVEGAGRGPGLAFVVGEDDLGIGLSGVLAEEQGELAAIGGTDGAGFAEVQVAGAVDIAGGGPGEAAVGGGDLVEGEGWGGGGGEGFGVEEATVVVEPGEVGAGASAHGFEGGHDDDAAPVTGRLEGGPGVAVVGGEGEAGGMEAGPEEEAFLALGVDDAVEGGGFEGGGPVLGNGEAWAPGAAGVGGSLEHDGSFAVALGVGAEQGFAVFEQDGGGVAEVLAGLTIDDDLALLVVGQIEQGWGDGGAGGEAGGEQEGEERGLGGGMEHGRRGWVRSGTRWGGGPGGIRSGAGSEGGRFSG